MRVINSGYEILTPISEGGIEELKRIERIGRVCYKSEDRITEDGESAKKFVKMLLDKGHEAMIEHSELSIMFTCDRGVSHEIVRHRMASYAQESTRYVNYANDKFGNEISVIDIKPGMDLDTKTSELHEYRLNAIYVEWLTAMRNAEEHYLNMIELGATPQIARSVLPNSVKTNITMTANYREWRHFFKLRTAKGAHPQMREIMVKLCKDLQSKIPIIFDDIDLGE